MNEEELIEEIKKDDEIEFKVEILSHIVVIESILALDGKTTPEKVKELCDETKKKIYTKMVKGLSEEQKSKIESIKKFEDFFKI